MAVTSRASSEHPICHKSYYCSRCLVTANPEQDGDIAGTTRKLYRLAGTTGKLYHPMFLSSDRYQMLISCQRITVTDI